MIGEEFFKAETKEELNAENLTRIQTIVSSGIMRQNVISSRFKHNSFDLQLMRMRVLLLP